MAWEEFERNGVKGITGDQPIDELALALDEIALQYEDRFSRKPTITEIVVALETVLGSNPNRYVSDSEGLEYGDITVKRDYSSKHDYDYVNVNEYEASAGAYPPGYIFVSRRASQKNNQAEVDVIKITKLDLQERNLQIEYEILTPDISTQMAQAIILKVVLDEFYDGDFHSEADNINFINIKSDDISVDYERHPMPDPQDS
jgi:hypothetical protein